MPDSVVFALPLVEVSAAVIVRDGRILLCRRVPGGSCGGLWEFPGGKIEPDETPAACAVRECREELGITIMPLRLLDTVEYAYPDKRVKLYFYEARLIQGEPSLRVHTALDWAAPPQLRRVSFCPADKTFIRKLPDFFKQ